MTDLVIRPATADDAEAMFALIQAHLSEGHLLPRELDELRRHADRFLVAYLGQLVACVELAPLSASVAEVRSLVVNRGVRGIGVVCGLVTANPGAAPRTGAITVRVRPCRRSAPSRMTRGFSCGRTSRSCRTPGCPRRSRPTASIARCSESASSTR